MAKPIVCWHCGKANRASLYCCEDCGAPIKAHPKKRKPKTKLEFDSVEPLDCPDCNCAHPMSFEFSFDPIPPLAPDEKCMAQEFYEKVLEQTCAAMGIPAKIFAGTDMVMTDPAAGCVSVYSPVLKDWITISPARLVQR